MRYPRTAVNPTATSNPSCLTSVIRTAALLTWLPSLIMGCGGVASVPSRAEQTTPTKPSIRSHQEAPETQELRQAYALSSIVIPEGFELYADGEGYLGYESDDIHWPLVFRLQDASIIVLYAQLDLESFGHVEEIMFADLDLVHHMEAMDPADYMQSLLPKAATQNDSEQPVWILSHDEVATSGGNRELGLARAAIPAGPIRMGPESCFHRPTPHDRMPITTQQSLRLAVPAGKICPQRPAAPTDGSCKDIFLSDALGTSLPGRSAALCLPVPTASPDVTTTVTNPSCQVAAGAIRRGMALAADRRMACPRSPGNTPQDWRTRAGKPTTQSAASGAASGSEGTGGNTYHPYPQQDGYSTHADSSYPEGFSPQSR